MMKKDQRFALLVGKAFLQEIQAGHRDTAIAFGRAFLLALGKQGPSTDDGFNALHGREHQHAMAMAHN
jgi:hypothetical protein